MVGLGGKLNLFYFISSPHSLQSNNGKPHFPLPIPSPHFPSQQNVVLVLQV